MEPHWNDVAEEQLRAMGIAKEQVVPLFQKNLSEGLSAIRQKARGRKETWCVVQGKGRLGVTFVEVDGRAWIQSLTLEHEDI
ncbi:MAG TPA: hypothetical protein VKX17_09905 [Planctomycetota bacterium]|nr:hypothetical protein [Planctomycetota bacterium]